jgi:hypothetical protein
LENNEKRNQLPVLEMPRIRPRRVRELRPGQHTILESQLPGMWKTEYSPETELDKRTDEREVPQWPKRNQISLKI